MCLSSSSFFGIWEWSERRSERMGFIGDRESRCISLIYSYGCRADVMSSVSRRWIQILKNLEFSVCSINEVNNILEIASCMMIDEYIIRLMACIKPVRLWQVERKNSIVWTHWKCDRYKIEYGRSYSRSNPDFLTKKKGESCEAI